MHFVQTLEKPLPQIRITVIYQLIPDLWDKRIRGITIMILVLFPGEFYPDLLSHDFTDCHQHIFKPYRMMPCDNDMLIQVLLI